MPTPVWVLSVDLQTKTATFQSGLSSAARTARGAFTEIKSGSSEMSSAVGGHMFASRHAVMAVTESLGVQMPRAITALLVHIGPLGAALEVAFPFAAIALGAVLLMEHLENLKAAGQKLTQDQTGFQTAVQNAFNTLDQRLIQSQIKTDELRNDHLGALRLQLELIDKQSLEQLVKSFGEVAKAADVVFDDLKTSWYQFGVGSAGAKHALTEFQSQYDLLLAKGKDKDASDLLSGTLASAKKVLQMQKDATATPKDVNAGGFTAEVAHERALADLRRSSVGFTEKEVKAQQRLVDALNDQVTIEGQVAALKGNDKNNASASTGKELEGLRAEGQRQAAEHARKMAELSLDIDRENNAAQMAVREASIAERLSADLALADKETAIQEQANTALIGALYKGGNDYNNQLKGLQDKAEEITRQHETTVAGLRAKASEEQNRKDLQDLEQNEREKIEATVQGSNARLAAIDAALKEEAAKNMQSSPNYRELQKQRVEAQREADEESAKLAAESGKEQAASTQKMGELALAAERSNQAVADSARRVTMQQRIAEETKFANEEYALKLAAMQQEAASLNKGAKDYQNKLKEMQNQERQLVQEHENQLTQIKNQAEIERNQKIIAAEQHFNDTLTAGFTRVLMGHKSFASVMNGIGNEVASGMMQNAMKMMEANLVGKQSDAAKAARTAYNIGLSMGGPAGVVLGPAFAAVAFSTVSGYQEGTDYVPGVGKGDKVPAMLEPGEGVVPGGVMDNLRSMARSGDMGGGKHFHTTMHFAPQIHAIDATGVDKMLDEHADKFHRAAERTLRKMNR